MNNLLLSAMDQYLLVMGKEIHYILEDVKTTMEDEGTLQLVVNVDANFDDEVLFEQFVGYVGLKERLSWRKAESSCVNKGGHLVSVRSQKEQEEVAAVANAAGILFFWQGATISHTGL